MTRSDRQAELAYATLLLERQLESYQRLHEEEMAALREALHELKSRILALGELQLEPQDEPVTDKPAAEERLS